MKRDVLYSYIKKEILEVSDEETSWQTYEIADSAHISYIHAARILEELSRDKFLKIKNIHPLVYVVDYDYLILVEPKDFESEESLVEKKMLEMGGIWSFIDIINVFHLTEFRAMNLLTKMIECTNHDIIMLKTFPLIKIKFKG